MGAALIWFVVAYPECVNMWLCSYAGALFAESCLKGLNGAKDIVECSYVASTVIPGLPFFSSKVYFITVPCVFRGSSDYLDQNHVAIW